MDNYKEKIFESGITVKEVKDFENKIEITLDYILEDYNYEPSNKQGLINALQYTMFETIIFDSSELNIDVNKIFERFHSDFNDPKSSKAVGSLQVILGSSYATDFKEDNVNLDISMLSNKIIKRNYNQYK